MGGEWRTLMAVMVMVVVVVVVGTEAANRRQERQVQICPRTSPCVPFNQCREFKRLLRQPNSDVFGKLQRARCEGGGGGLLFKVCCPRSSDIKFPSQGGESLLPSKCQTGTSSTPVLNPNIPSLPFPSLPFPSWPSKPLGPIFAQPNPNFDLLARPSRPGGLALVKRALKPELAVSEEIPSVPEWVQGGEDVELTQPFPWMAVLGYNSKTSPVWACGGSLITSQYVITAAHCVHDDFTRGLTLEVVRLGELNLATARDCVSGRFNDVCSPTPQDFSPAQVMFHPDFNTRTTVSDDIALIRLDRVANYNKFVSPICLPAPGVSVKAALSGSQNGELAGWGLNETLGNTASVLQRALIPFVEKEQCIQHFPKLVPEQVCFGGGNQDSCQGDSGGPVFIRGWSGILLLGLVSHGLDYRCGTFGIPAVYTDVTAYRNWIIGELKP